MSYLLFAVCSVIQDRNPHCDVLCDLIIIPIYCLTRLKVLLACRHLLKSQPAPKHIAPMDQQCLPRAVSATILDILSRLVTLGLRFDDSKARLQLALMSLAQTFLSLIALHYRYPVFWTYPPDDLLKPAVTEPTIRD